MALGLNQAIGLRIRHARLAAKLTQERLAEAVGRTKEAISNLERGINPPTLETLVRICDVLTVPLSDIVADPGGDHKTLELKSELDTVFRRLNPREAATLVRIAKAFVQEDS